MPTTNAGSEHSFSALRRIKSYLKSTMSQIRLMVLHACTLKELTDRLHLIEVANKFASNKSTVKYLLEILRGTSGVIVCLEKSQVVVPAI